MPRTSTPTAERTDREILIDIAELIAGGAPDEFPAGSIEALGHAIALFDTLTPKALESLRAVVVYCWASEERDYRAASPSGRRGHIFSHLRRLRTLARRLERHNR